MSGQSDAWVEIQELQIMIDSLNERMDRHNQDLRNWIQESNRVVDQLRELIDDQDTGGKLNK